MAASKRKKIKQVEQPQKPRATQEHDTEGYYKKHPAWNFNTCDTDMWPLSEECAGCAFWSEILPFLKSTETRTWGDILQTSKKQNHSIEAQTLNPIAQKRLEQKYIEQESVISLRITATHRLYGYIVDYVFNILWYDTGHGDNDTCVCRSHKRNT